jgi:hypothetical protein
MEPGYEITPARLGRSSHRRVAVVAASIVVLLGLVVVKPWAGSAPADRQEPAVASSATAAAVVPPSAAANGGPSRAATSTDIGSLAAHAGTWGVGDGGAGPRLIRDEPWLDWQDVVPETSSDIPDRIATWPGTDICERLPVLFDRPLFVAVTAPIDLQADWRLEGWWSDGGRVASLDGSVRQMSPPGVGGISYLERLDGQPWPDGRYEFHVVASDSTLALTFCLARTGSALARSGRNQPAMEPGGGGTEPSPG